MAESNVGVLGATSLVGACLLPLLACSGWHVTAYTRQPVGHAGDGVVWKQLSLNHAKTVEEVTPYWLCVAPIWVLPDYFALIETSGARRVVVLSSSSRFTKVGSGDMAEQATAAKLIDGETRLQAWAESRGIEWTILCPTLIYGIGRDKNISEIARFIRRFGFFPVLGEAKGLRQPIHAEDVAGACLAALQGSDADLPRDGRPYVYGAWSPPACPDCPALGFPSGGDHAAPLATLSAMVVCHGRAHEPRFGV